MKRKKIMKNCSKNIRFKFLFVLPRNNLFLDLQRINNEGKTILVVTHENDIANMCKRIVHLKDGIIVEDKKIKQNIIKDV